MTVKKLLATSHVIAVGMQLFLLMIWSAADPLYGCHLLSISECSAYQMFIWGFRCAVCALVAATTAIAVSFMVIHRSRGDRE